jgi:hypothetical protein
LFVLVTSHRTIDLVTPKFGSGLRIISVPAVCVVMPKAPVDEDNGFEPWEGYVWFSRKVADVDPKPEAQSVQQGAHDDLRLRVASAYAAHYPTAFLFRKYINQLKRLPCHKSAPMRALAAGNLCGRPGSQG